MKLYNVISLLLALGLSTTLSATGDCSVGYAFMKNGQYEAAYSEFRRLAERGYPYYINTVAAMHKQGQGVPSSDMMAHVWYSLSAAQGDEVGLQAKARLASQLSHAQLIDSSYLSSEYAGEYLAPYIAIWSLNE